MEDERGWKSEKGLKISLTSFSGKSKGLVRQVLGRREIKDGRRKSKQGEKVELVFGRGGMQEMVGKG